MFINLKETSQVKLYHIARWINLSKPKNNFVEKSRKLHPGDVTWGPVLKNEWGYSYHLETPPVERAYHEKVTQISVSNYQHRFVTDPEYIRNEVSWTDLIRVILAAELGDFWVDLPDDLCEKLEGLPCT